MISWKCISFLDISITQNPSKITKTISQGIMFVIISCQRVHGIVVAMRSSSTDYRSWKAPPRARTLFSSSASRRSRAWEQNGAPQTSDYKWGHCSLRRDRGVRIGFLSALSLQIHPLPTSRLKKTRPFRFLLLKSVVLDSFMVSSFLLGGCPPAKTWQSMRGAARKLQKSKVTF